MDLKKKLWLKMAHFLMKSHSKQALQLLHECDLQLQDLLPLFPDFVYIDDWKEFIVSALDQYSQEMKNLKEELVQVVSSSESVRLELQKLKSR